MNAVLRLIVLIGGAGGTPEGTAAVEILWDEGDALAWDEGDWIAWD